MHVVLDHHLNKLDYFFLDLGITPNLDNGKYIYIYIKKKMDVGLIIISINRALKVL